MAIVCIYIDLGNSGGYLQKFLDAGVLSESAKNELPFELKEDRTADCNINERNKYKVICRFI